MSGNNSQSPVDLSALKRLMVAPQCPFCRMRMDSAYDSRRKIDTWACHRCRIAIAKTDPLVGTWDNPKRERVECPNCNADMPVFFTSTGFFLARCPKKGCRCEVKQTEVKENTPPAPGAVIVKDEERGRA